MLNAAANPLHRVIVCDYANPVILADLRRLILADIRQLRDRDLGGLIAFKGEDNFSHIKRNCAALIERFRIMGGSRISVACFRRALRDLQGVR